MSYNLTDKKRTSNLRRCLVWMAWGEKHIRLAEQSRSSAAKLLPYPSILITDVTNSVLGVDVGFDHIVKADFASDDGSNQRKSEMWRWLPEQYDSFLFLDTDTHVLGDVTFGFEQAEEYHFAMVPAAHYCMDHFWGFDEVMARELMPRCGQLQYNSGVIFFVRTDVTASVFQRWNELTRCYPQPFDQSFLSLAFEQLGIRPYVLSPNYNYRGMGVPIIGEVRIWHTPHPPPTNVNAHPDWWPMRYFVNGRLHHPGRLKHTLRRAARRLTQAVGLPHSVVRRLTSAH